MADLTRVVYWDAPLWQVLAAAAITVGVLGWLLRRALVRPRTPDVLASLDPSLDRIALFLYDGVRGIRPLSSGAARLHATMRSDPTVRPVAEMSETAMRAVEQASVLRRSDWPMASHTLLAVPLSADGRSASAALALVVDDGLAPPSDVVAVPGEPWATEDWQRLGADLHAHRARPLVRVRRAAPGGDAAPTWTETTLSPTEEALLRHLLANEGAVQGADALFAVVWPTEELDRLGLRPDQRERLRRLVFQLRQRLEVEPAEPRHLRTAHGIGYVFYRDAGPDGT